MNTPDFSGLDRALGVVAAPHRDAITDTLAQKVSWLEAKLFAANEIISSQATDIDTARTIIAERGERITTTVAELLTGLEQIDRAEYDAKGLRYARGCVRRALEHLDGTAR